MRGGVINYVTGKPDSLTRRNRVALLSTKPSVQRGIVEATPLQKLMASKWMGSNTKPLPVGSLKKRGGRLTEYELRALNELSHRSLNVAKMNIKSLKNKKNKRNIANAYNKTRKIRR